MGDMLLFKDTFTERLGKGIVTVKYFYYVRKNVIYYLSRFIIDGTSTVDGWPSAQTVLNEDGWPHINR